VALAEEAVEATRAAVGVPSLVVAVHSMFAPRALPLVLGALTSLPRRVSVRDAHSDVVTALVLDGTAHLGFAVPGATPPGLRRVHLRPDPIWCVVSPEHPMARAGRTAAGALRSSLLALNGWGPGFEGFLERLRRRGVDEWRIRYCGDAATSITLARDHGHVALVPESAAAPVVDDGTLRRVSLAGLRSWTMPLDLLHRSGADDRAVAAVAAAVTRR
jgi:DNA-binding transcriptional LysR family regulator